MKGDYRAGRTALFGASEDFYNGTDKGTPGAFNTGSVAEESSAGWMLY